MKLLRSLFRDTRTKFACIYFPNTESDVGACSRCHPCVQNTVHVINIILGPNTVQMLNIVHEANIVHALNTVHKVNIVHAANVGRGVLWATPKRVKFESGMTDVVFVSNTVRGA